MKFHHTFILTLKKIKLQFLPTLTKYFLRFESVRAKPRESTETNLCVCTAQKRDQRSKDGEKMRKKKARRFVTKNSSPSKKARNLLKDANSLYSL